MNKTHRASAGGKAADHSSPLKEVVGMVEPFEVLECGHKHVVNQDIAGRYYARRRRCKKCASGKPRDYSEAAVDELKGGMTA